MEESGNTRKGTMHLKNDAEEAIKGTVISLVTRVLPMLRDGTRPTFFFRPSAELNAIDVPLLLHVV
jgi:hypothetical protein